MYKWVPVGKEGAKKNSQSLHATETGISSGLMGHLARMQALPFLSYSDNLIMMALAFSFNVKYFGLSYAGGLGSSVILGDLDRKNYMEKLISFLDPVLLNSQRSGFVRCWHAKTDGSSVSTFHSNCDGKGPTVTIIKSGSYIFGAYTDVSWHSSKYQIVVFFSGAAILYFPIPHNALCLPPKFCIDYCCEMFLGGLRIPNSILQQ